jgi:hypothetical protein
MKASIMDWVPIVFVTFKVVALSTAMFLAIKWHYDQGKRGKGRALLRSGGTAVAIFLLVAVALGIATFVLARALGLDLGW